MHFGRRNLLKSLFQSLHHSRIEVGHESNSVHLPLPGLKKQHSLGTNFFSKQVHLQLMTSPPATLAKFMGLAYANALNKLAPG